MTNHDLLIVNGRVYGDMRDMLSMEWFVSCWHAAYKNEILCRINYFSVGDIEWFSDHAYISADLALDIAKYKAIPQEWLTVNWQFQNWDDLSKNMMREKLQAPEYATKLSNFPTTHLSSSTEAANSLALIIQSALKNIPS